MNVVLDFLTEQFENGCGYSSLNTARCALSAIGLIKDGFAIGAHPIVIRFMRGIFNLKPVKSRYSETWDVNKVLIYLRTLSNCKIIIKDAESKINNVTCSYNG